MASAQPGVNAGPNTACGGNARERAWAGSRIEADVGRNREGFPGDCAYQLTQQEVADLMSQIVISKSGGDARERVWAESKIEASVGRNRERSPEDFSYQLTQQEFTDLISQIVISRNDHGGRRKLPWAFTEHGVVIWSGFHVREKA